MKAKKIPKAAFDASEIRDKDAKFSLGDDRLDKLASQV